ncbi:MAG: hypothetical protein HGB04_01305 [Chlorobiaceae bacterium]|nr:hypothetical protein [Chlorobiaceae bacterium]
MMKKRTIFILLLLAALGAGRAEAADYTVDSNDPGISGTGDSGTLRYVIGRLNASGSSSANTVTFSSGGTFALTSPLSLIKPVDFAVDPSIGEVLIQNPNGVYQSESWVLAISTPASGSIDGISMDIPEGIRLLRSTSATYAYGINWKYSNNSSIGVLGGTLEASSKNVGVALYMPYHYGDIADPISAHIGSFTSTGRILAAGSYFASGMSVAYDLYNSFPNILYGSSTVVIDHLDGKIDATADYLATGVIQAYTNELVINRFDGTITATGMEPVGILGGSLSLGQMGGTITATATTPNPLNINRRLYGGLAGGICLWSFPMSQSESSFPAYYEPDYVLMTQNLLKITGGMNGTITVRGSSNPQDPSLEGMSFGIYAQNGIIGAWNRPDKVKDHYTEMLDFSTAGSAPIGGKIDVSGYGYAVAIGASEGPMNLSITGDITAHDLSGRGNSYSVLSREVSLKFMENGLVNQIPDAGIYSPVLEPNMEASSRQFVYIPDGATTLSDLVEIPDRLSISGDALLTGGIDLGSGSDVVTMSGNAKVVGNIELGGMYRRQYANLGDAAPGTVILPEPGEGYNTLTMSDQTRVTGNIAFGWGKVEVGTNNTNSGKRNALTMSGSSRIDGSVRFGADSYQQARYLTAITTYPSTQYWDYNTLAYTLSLSGGAPVYDTVTDPGGDDTLEMSGTSSIGGNVTFGTGNDLMTLVDGASISGSVDGGTGSDTLVFNAENMNMTVSNDFIGFETIDKTGSKTLTLGTGRSLGSNAFNLRAGTVDNFGTMAADTFRMGDGNAGTTSALIDEAGGTVTIAGGDGVLQGDGGVQQVTVAGTITGSIALVAGNDTMTLVDAGSISGSIDGGDGSDTFTFHAATLDMTASKIFTNFETIEKTGSKTLTIGSSRSLGSNAFNLKAGTVDNFGTVGADTFLMGDGTTGTTTTLINEAAGTISIAGGDGVLLGDGGVQQVTVAGTINGSVDLGAGNDSLTLVDAASISGSVNGGNGSDQLTFDAATVDMTISNDVSSFETIDKTGSKTLTLGTGRSLGSNAFNLKAGTVDNSGNLTEADTFLMGDGTAGTTTALFDQASGTITIAGGSGVVRGDDGVQQVTVAGTINAGVELGAGNDTLTLIDAGSISGSVMGGNGSDLLTFNAATVDMRMSNDFSGFETIEKTGTRKLTLGSGSSLGGNDFHLQAGTVDNSGTVAADTFLMGDGTAGTTALFDQASGTITIAGGSGVLQGDDGVQQVTVAGTINAGVELGAGNDTLTLIDAGSISGSVMGGNGSDLLTFNAATVDMRVSNDFSGFETIEKTGTRKLTLGSGSSLGGNDFHLQAGTVDNFGTVAADTFLMGDGTAGTTALFDQAGGTITIAGGSGVVRGDDGVQQVTVAGTINAGVELGAGNDTLTLTDAGSISGSVMGGNGSDLLTFNAATVDMRVSNDFSGFETIEKTGTRKLTLGTGKSLSGEEFNLRAGTVENFGTVTVTTFDMIGDGTTLSNKADATVTVGAGGQGTLTGGPGSQAIDNSGTIAASIDLGAGDDRVSNRGSITGAVELGTGNDSYTWWVTGAPTQAAIVSGGDGTDALLYGVDAGQSFVMASLPAGDGVPTGFEAIGKDGAGTLTLEFGTSLLTNGLDIAGGTLILKSALTAATSAGITGSGYVRLSGANTLLDNRAALGAGDRFEMTGDGARLVNAAGASVTVAGTGTITGGDGSQAIENSGTITAAIDLGAGNDRLTLIDAGSISGNVAGGGGSDTLTFDAATVDMTVSNDFSGFETIDKTGSKKLTLVSGRSLGGNAFNLKGGSMDNSGNLTAADTFLMGDGAAGTTTTLFDQAGGTISVGGGNGMIQGDLGIQQVTVAGTIRTGISLGPGEDLLKLTGKADLSGATRIEGGAGSADRLWMSGWQTDNDAATADIPSGFSTNVTGWEFITVGDDAAGNHSDVYLGPTPDRSHPLTFSPSAGETLQMTIEAGSIVRAIGSSPGRYVIAGNLTNAGTVSLYDGQPDDRLTVDGTYAGVAGSMLMLDVPLGEGSKGWSDAENLDLLEVGASTGTGTRIVVHNYSGATVRKTTGNGILVVKLNGTNTGASFTIDDKDPVFQGATVQLAALTDGWYLQILGNGSDGGDTPTPPPPPPDGHPDVVASVYGVGTLAYDSMPRFHERQAYGWSVPGQEREPASWWMRTTGTRFRSGIGSAGTEYRASGYRNTMQVGADLSACLCGGTLYRKGIFAGTSYLKADNFGSGDAKSGKTEVFGMGLGGYTSVERRGRWYAEAVAQANRWDISSSVISTGTRPNAKSWSYGASLEGGAYVKVTDGFRLEPQAQLMWQRMEGYWMQVTAASLARVESMTGLQGRVGVTGMIMPKGWCLNPMFELNAVREFGDDAEVSWAQTGRRYGVKIDRTWLGGALGIVSRNSRPECLEYYAKAGLMAGVDGHQGRDWTITAGIRKSW